MIKKMKRFNRSPIDKFGFVIIYDIENTEPVCTIYANYHPYAPEIIENVLNEKAS